MKKMLVVISALFLTACASQKIVLPPETFQPQLTQMCEPELAQLNGTTGGAILMTMQQWNESYRRCEALNNSKVQYMLKLQEIIKKNNSMLVY